MNLGQLEVFVAIVDAGNLSEAGDLVGLTQSAVSYSLSRLETELGVTLFERGRRGVTLTRAGDDLLPHARAILGQLEILRQKAAQQRGLTTGKVRFGCVPTIPGRLLAGILRSFQQKYPDIDVVVFEGTPVELIEWLASGLVDVATVTQPRNDQVFVPFVHTELKVIMAEHHRLADRHQIGIESMVDESLIGPRVEYGIILNQLFQPYSMPMPKLKYAVSSQNTIFAMVREQMGVALMLDILCDPKLEGIVARPLSPRFFVDIYLAANLRLPAVQVFMNNAADWVREHDFGS